MFVKVCGITTEEDALLAIGMGADALGFNFVPGSSRQIRPAVARDIVRRLPGGVLTVGLVAGSALWAARRWTRNRVWNDWTGGRALNRPV